MSFTAGHDVQRNIENLELVLLHTSAARKSKLGQELMKLRTAAPLLADKSAKTGT